MLNRRSAITVIASTALLGSIGGASAATSAMRKFDILRDNTKIGEHLVTVRSENGALVARTDVDIAVKFIGITAYRYTLGYDERYENGRLVSLNGTANDDGDKGFVRAAAAGNMLEVDGSSFSGQLDGSAVPTSYWRKAAKTANQWISTQTGLVLNVSTGAGSSPFAASGMSVWNATAPEDDFAVDLFFDARDEWVGSAFIAGGEQGIYQVADETGALNALA